MNKKDKKGGATKPNVPRFSFLWIYIAILAALILVNVFGSGPSAEEINFRDFKSHLVTGDVDRIVVVNNEKVEVFLSEESLKKDVHKEVAERGFRGTSSGPHYYFTIGSIDYFQQQLDDVQADLPREDRVSPQFEKRENWFANILSWIIPFAIIILIWIFIMRRASGGGMGGAGGMMKIGKSKAQLFDAKTKVKVTFDQVAGLDEAKEEIFEVVDFLKHPKKYKDLGAKIPKGVLLTGPPGTGKTLIAKAMAGESGVPFFTISGSDFVEMFVGVGAARVRDLFKNAKEKAPCIIFIDEIEAIGRSRGRSNTQTNDERENTLNQLLVEMDGFGSEHEIIVLAATNRPDLLDNALTRPGRFDRQIHIDKPDLNGREAIFKVHLKKIKIDDSVDAQKLAQQTPGFAGAEIANICNEAALHAARRKSKIVQMQDFNSAIDRVIGGLEKKNKLITTNEKKIIAYHETGHALCGWYLKHASPLVKVSIVPRGMAALGFAQYLPKERNLYSREQLMDTIVMTLGGRAAEELIFGDITTGAQNDLEKTTETVYAMLAIYGMNEKIGQFSFKNLREEYSFRQPYSEETAKLIDNEARIIIDEAYKRAKKLLTDNKDKLEKVAQALIEKEVLHKKDFEELVGEKPVGENEAED